MGIKSFIVKAGGKAADVVAKASSLSPEQIARVQESRERYLSEMPDLEGEQASEQTRRLLAACGVDIYNAYLTQLASLYRPIEPEIELGAPFNTLHNLRFIPITKWATDKAENSLEKLTNVYEVLANETCNIALVFHRSQHESNIYLAVCDTTNSDNNVNAEELIRRISNAIKGNFPGSQTGEVHRGSIPELSECQHPSIAIVSNIPGEKSEHFVSQTIEKILDGIVPASPEQEYSIILIATPVSDVESRKLHLEELYSALNPYSSWQTQFTYQESDSQSSSATVGVNVGVSAGMQNGTNASIASQQGETASANKSVADSTNQTETDAEGTSESHTDGKNSSTGGSIFGSADVKVLNIKGTVGGSISHSRGKTSSDSTGTSSSHSTASSVGRAITNSLGKAVTQSVTNTVGKTLSHSLGANFGMNFARSSSVIATIGKSESIMQSFTNYSIAYTLEKLKNQLQRYEQATALGMWDFAAYVLSDDQSIANNVAHSYLALTQGEESFISQSAINLWRGDIEESDDAETLLRYIQELRHPVFSLNPALIERDGDYRAYPPIVDAATGITGKELAYSLNFPSKSVAGLPILSCTAFGRNVTSFDERTRQEQTISIGKIFHMHREEETPVHLSVNSLSSHTFITGSTGAGKSNAIYCLLEQLVAAGKTFLAIEPAKGEYKNVFGSSGLASVYGTSPQMAPMLQLNPFSFPDAIHVLEHLDRLVEIFNACWPMYAAMPAVLKAAVEQSYEDCGWDLMTSTNPYGNNLYPTFSDVCRNVRSFIETSDYDEENKGAYKGSLLTRLQSLTTGINGMVFTKHELSDDELFECNTVVDLSRVGSNETKSLLMGILILKLQEHRMATAQGMNAPLQHITVLEEAHNILRRTSGEQVTESANLQGKSVEMISNAIAEMRTYGKGFIIADQAPGLLDMAAIRNTNTKVILRLPDQSDRELAGKAAGLTDEQITELAKLPRGVAAIFQNEWIEPVLCKINRSEAPESLYRYERIEESPHEGQPSDALSIAEALSGVAQLGRDTSFEEIRSAMNRLELNASDQVSMLRYIEEAHSDPRPSRLAPMMARLFPSVQESIARAYEETDNVDDWTRAGTEALSAILNDEPIPFVRRAIVQSIIHNFLVNERKDFDAYINWEQRAVM
ncbi:helicase HerA domain-containing protein [Enorma massiliensis]|uniref:ATP-binding protein n=1 Tax=Enorma massiliensis TaxID=1472761 RepID=UPI003AF079F7